MTAANLVPNKLAPRYLSKSSGVRQVDAEPNENGPADAQRTPDVNNCIDKLFSKLDLEGIKDWTEQEQGSIKQLLTDYNDIFALNSMELGKTDIAKHTIEVTNLVPFKERYQQIPPHQFEEVRKHLKEMEEIGAIRRSNSPWASPVVLVRKKDGTLCFCIDLQKLNERTIKDAYSLPRIEESLDCLNGSKIFMSLDLKSGYWQMELDEDSIPLTAFMVGPLGFYECVQMPFGLTNAPETFQCLMESCLGELHLNWCIIYLDDVIVHANTPKEHIERLKGVFEKLRKAGLKLKPSKCEFFRDRIAYLGHIVSKDGIEADPKKIKEIQEWPVPETGTDVKSFLGFTNYYRKFVHKYAHIAKPLHELTSGENANRKKKVVEWLTVHQMLLKS